MDNFFKNIPEDIENVDSRTFRGTLNKMKDEVSPDKVDGFVLEIFGNGKLKSLDRKELKKKLYYSDTTNLGQS